MFQVRKILVATDFSPCSAAALDRAADLAKTLQAEILLLHVLPNPTHYAPFPQLVPMPHEWLETVRKEALDRLGKESRRIKGTVVKTELREGPTHDAIVGAAEGREGRHDRDRHARAQRRPARAARQRCGARRALLSRARPHRADSRVRSAAMGGAWAGPSARRRPPRLA
jgi:hypothetical protein